MKRIVLGLLLAVAIMSSSCNAKREWDAKKILKQEEALLAKAKISQVDSADVAGLLNAYEGYAEKHPNDTMGIEFLFKAASFYEYLGKPIKGASIYEKVYTNYPSYSKRPYALFMQGLIYEDKLGNLDVARQKYSQFLKEYPEHPIAKDVKIALAQLGKTPEQLMAEIMAAQHQDSTAVASEEVSELGK